VVGGRAGVVGRRREGEHMTSTSADIPTTFTARAPEDLLAAAPLVLGFEPADSLVLLTFGGLRPFHARTDLPPAGQITAEVGETLADTLLDPARQQQVAKIAFLCYTGEPRAADRVWRPFRRGCARSGIEIVTGLRAAGGRYHPLRGDRRLRDAGVPYDLSTHPFTARAVAAGLVTHRSRAELVDTVTPDAAAQARVAAAQSAAGLLDAGLPVTGHAIRAAGEDARALVRRHAEAGTTASDAEVATLVWHLQVPRVRDAVWSLLSRDVSETHLRFWRDVMRRTPEPQLAAPAVLLGWSAWQAGQGALAWAGADACRAVDPEHGLAELLVHVLTHAIPPDEWQGGFDWAEDLAG
jgi:hypothetical protein